MIQNIESIGTEQNAVHACLKIVQKQLKLLQQFPIAHETQSTDQPKPSKAVIDEHQQPSKSAQSSLH
jgi:hypothetical protein